MFAFLIHPRNKQDIINAFPFTKYIPQNIISFFLSYFKPFVLSKITGAPTSGYLIVIPLTLQVMLGNKALAVKRITQGVQLAEKLGVNILGLGAFTSSLTKGGEDLVKKTKIAITSGNTYTAGIILESLKKIGLPKTVAIVGATGSIGSVISHILTSEKEIKKLILIARNTKETLEDIKEADLVIVVTTASDYLIQEDHLKNGAIVYDITQPSNVSPEILKKRPDIKLIRGGLVSTPKINYHYNWRLPPEVAFACVAETIFLDAEKKYQNFVGKVKIENIDEFLFLGKKYNFEIVWI